MEPGRVCACVAAAAAAGLLAGWLVPGGGGGDAGESVGTAAYEECSEYLGDGRFDRCVRAYCEERMPGYDGYENCWRQADYEAMKGR